MAHFYGNEIRGSHLRVVIALFVVKLPLTDGGNIIWLEPPPFETNASSISRTNKLVIQGSLNEELSCSFSLTRDLIITTVSMKFRGQPAVAFVPNVSLMVEPVFAKHFDAVWVPNRLTLILFNVTDAHEGEYCCEVIAIGRSARSWIRKIKLSVFDPIQTTVSGIKASEDPIQTTDYSTTASEVDDQRTVIGAGVGVAVFAIIIITMTIGCYYVKRRKLVLDF